MAVVLSSEENNYFSSSTLRRSHSQPKFVTKRSGFQTSASASRISDLYPESSKAFSDSPPSSAQSSPRVTRAGSDDLSYSSTPGTNFSLGSDCDEDEDDHLEFGLEDSAFPQYDEAGYFDHTEDLDPSPSPRTGGSPNSSPNEQDNSNNTSRPGSPDKLERAEDDIAIRAQPSRHVDYLSHNWREEDIWSSWKLIVSRRGDYTNSTRLENASWRTWMKAKNKLSTVSPDALNWLKDHDVTWLYGPLQPGTAHLNPIHTSSTSGRLSKSSSFVKKPILKKRSMSEIMLQRSLSTSSLVKQAAAAVQAQQKEGLKRIGRRPGLERAATDYITFQFSSRRVSNDNTSLFPSAVSSGFVSPGGEKKHIHFNEQVAQCIAVDVKGDDEEDEADRFAFDSDSDDGAIMMKRTKIKMRRPTIKRAKSHNAATESKTIAMLPSTTLKYREDTPEPTETAMKHSTGVFRSPVISPSSSQETLRPSKKSGKLFIAEDSEEDDEDEDDEDDEDDDSTEPAPIQSGAGGSFGLRRSASSNSMAAEPTGMRRTESGMFMPLDQDGEPSSAGEGLFGRVIDTKEAALKNTNRLRPGPNTKNFSRSVR